MEEWAWHLELDLQYWETSASRIINQYHTAGLLCNWPVYYWGTNVAHI